jgi:hypothetical protein
MPTNALLRLMRKLKLLSLPLLFCWQAIPETGGADPHFDSSQNLSTFLHRDSKPMTAKKSSMLIIFGNNHMSYQPINKSGIEKF